MKNTNYCSDKLAKTISCEFDYCIYNNEKQCILSCISISAEGLCDDCITPNIDKKILEKYKKATREKID